MKLPRLRSRPRPRLSRRFPLSFLRWFSFAPLCTALSHPAPPSIEEHAIFTAPDGSLAARNPGQKWDIRFDREGFIVSADVGGWAWGLALQRYGFAGSELSVGGHANISTAPNQVSYERHADLQEWLVNDEQGLEQGWTVHRRPPGSSRPSAVVAWERDPALGRRWHPSRMQTILPSGDRWCRFAQPPAIGLDAFSVLEARKIASLLEARS